MRGFNDQPKQRLDNCSQRMHHVRASKRHPNAFLPQESPATFRFDTSYMEASHKIHPKSSPALKFCWAPPGNTIHWLSVADSLTIHQLEAVARRSHLSVDPLVMIRLCVINAQRRIQWQWLVELQSLNTNPSRQGFRRLTSLLKTRLGRCESKLDPNQAGIRSRAGSVPQRGWRCARTV